MSRRLERGHLLSAGRPAHLRRLSLQTTPGFTPEAAWLRARLSGRDPADPAVADPAISAVAWAPDPAPDSAPSPASSWSDDAEIAGSAALVPAAVLIPMITGPAGGILLTKRSAALRRHSGQVSFPGGRIDPEDAGPEAAALREAEEEVGLPAAGIEVIGRLRDYVTGTGYKVTPVMGLIAPGYTVTLAPAEVDAVFVLPWSTLLDETAPEQRTTEYRGKMRQYWVWPHPDHYIWGATAAILVHLARRLRDAP
jgi:8-oxo-dGTP pyrophosphatase MutT (NUDIX family)